MLAHGYFRFLLIAAGIFLVFGLGLVFTLRGPLQQPNGVFHKLGEYNPSWFEKLGDNAKAILAGGKGAVNGVALDDNNEEEGEEEIINLSDSLTQEQKEASLRNMAMEHKTVYSSMTKDRDFFMFDFGDHHGYNPGIIPHPYKEETYIVIAQRDKSKDDSGIWASELYCEATFVNNIMKCTKSALILPIASTTSRHCTGDLDWFNANRGPHDARMFHGLDRPYALYNSQSNFNCIGQWLHDLRQLVDWDPSDQANETQKFFQPVNLQRPPPWRSTEKNWFPFWDYKGEMYLHYDIVPTRSFAKLKPDGSVGKDMAPLAAKSDSVCMDRLMPTLQQTNLEWLHQATNSLAITLCRRSEPGCERRVDNTYIFTLFQTKTFYMHGVYEPYFMLFKQTPPFEVYGITTKPIWYSGRGKPGGSWIKGTALPKDQSQLLFTTSMSWKRRESRYHGFLDDVLFLSFGIEDKAAGAIDVVAEELLSDLGLCDSQP